MEEQDFVKEYDKDKMISDIIFMFGEGKDKLSDLAKFDVLKAIGWHFTERKGKHDPKAKIWGCTYWSHNAYEIAFKETKSEDGWAAAILMNGKSITRPYRKISLDFEILGGFYDLLCLLAAFIDPDQNVVFIVKDSEGVVMESYFVYYEEDKEKRRCVMRLE